MTGTDDAFAAAKAEGRGALVGYLPAGFPDVDGSIEAMRTMVEAGCDVIEVGLPYSDPVMDGPTIQAAAQQALEGGVRTRDVLRTVEAVAATGTPTVVMTYWNPVDRYGVERFAADLAGAGGAGLITPDLTPDSGAEWIAAALKANKRATIVGTFLGVITFALIFNLLTLMDLAVEIQQITKGLIILAAVLVQRKER